MSVAASRALLRAFTVALACLPALAGSAAAFDGTFDRSEPSFRIAALEHGFALPGERGPFARPPLPAEPFGLLTRDAPEGGASIKWRNVEAGMRLDMQIVARCRAEPDICPSPAAQRFIAIVEAARAREGRARIGELNRAVNLLIRAVSDAAQYGVLDVWSPPLATLDRGRGDCEDYAILKYAALRELGVPDPDLRLLVVRGPTGPAHAITSVRLEGRWLILDNRRFALVEDIHLRDRPLFAMNEDGVRTFETQPAPAGPVAIAGRTAASLEFQGFGSWSAAPLLM